MEIKRSYDRLISTIGFPILARWHLYIESGPCLLQKQLTIQWQTQWYFCVSLSQNSGSINIFVSLMWRKICPSFSGNPWNRCFCSHDKNGVDKKVVVRSRWRIEHYWNLFCSYYGSRLFKMPAWTYMHMYKVDPCTPAVHRLSIFMHMHIK